jgi:C-terminal processing protease CtpA/Prc
MPAQISRPIVLAFLLFLALAPMSHAAEQKLGLAVDVKGEGFFLNPVVTEIIVSEVTKGTLADTAGIKAGDHIIRIEGRNVAGMRALELRPYMKLDPGQTRSFRLKHANGTESDVRLTKPKT